MCPQPIKEYTVAIGRATRDSARLRLGASPRSLLQLLRAAKATAALDGRDFVLPDDVVDVAESVLAHRIILDRKAASWAIPPQSIIRGIPSAARCPGPRRRRVAQGQAQGFSRAEAAGPG